MFKRAISLLTLMAFTFYSFAFSGCTTTVRLPIAEVSLEPPKKVTRLKHRSGKQTVWDARGAEYICKARQFEGVTGDGSRKSVGLVLVDSVYFVIGEEVAEQALDAKTFHDAAVARQRHSIRGQIKGVISDNGTYRFKKEPAQIDTLNQAVVGIVESGDTLSIPLSEVQYLKVRRTATREIVLVIVGLGVLAVVVTAIVVSQMDFSLWDSPSQTSH